MSLLVVEGVSKTFPGRQVPSIQDIGFTMEAGDTLGVVGESGSGKSTTAKCVAALLKPDHGRITLDGTSITGANRATITRMRRDMQMVFQDPYSSLNPRMKVHDLIAEGMIVHKLESSAARRKDRVVELLETVGLGAEHLDRYPRSFSGGQRQRIAIARALSVGPKLLICDEPVSSLDVSVQAQVLNLLRDLREELGLAILFIAHDLAVVRYLCESVAVMQNGRIVEQGTRDAVFDNPSHPYTQALLAAVPVPEPALQRARQADQRRLLHAGARGEVK